MKLVHTRAGWITEGAFVTALPPGKPVDRECMATYYGLHPGDPKYEELSAPRPFARVILMKLNIRFTIVPMSKFVEALP